jgi:hypothetical protein
MFWVRAIDPLEDDRNPFEPDAEWLGRVQSIVVFSDDALPVEGSPIVFTPKAIVGVEEID